MGFFDSPQFQATAVTINGIQCWEESATNQLGRTSSQCTRQILCLWDDTPALMSFFLGGGAIASGAVLNFDPPKRHPRFPWLYVDSVDAQPIGLQSQDNVLGMIRFEAERLTISYKNPDVLEGLETGTESLDYSADMLSVPQDASVFKWADDSTDVTPEASPALPVTTVEFTWARKFQPSIPTSLIIASIDHTNQSSFFGGGPGTVLYCGAKTTRRFTSAGAQQWDVTHSFKYRASGWNSFLKPGSAGYVGIVLKSTGAPPFPQTDLTPLLNS